jgi:hypothetical protein
VIVWAGVFFFLFFFFSLFFMVGFSWVVIFRSGEVGLLPNLLWQKAAAMEPA